MYNSELPAYPGRRFEDGEPWFEPGMTKLEAFTMAAMKGLCSAVCHGIECRELTTVDISAISCGAIEIAKATLAELSKHQ